MLRSQPKKKNELSQKEKKDAQKKTQTNAEKIKKITGKEKKGEAIKHSTSKKGITRGKSPPYRHVVTNSRRGMSDKEDEMTVEFRDTHKAQPLPGDIRGR